MELKLTRGNSLWGCMIDYILPCAGICACRISWFHLLSMATPSFSVAVVVLICLLREGSGHGSTLLIEQLLSPIKNTPFISGELQKHTRTWIRLEDTKHALLLSSCWHLEHPIPLELFVHRIMKPVFKFHFYPLRQNIC